MLTAVTPIPEIRHDGELIIAIGSSRFEKRWRNKSMRWSELLARFGSVTRTQESIAEYLALPKTRQDEIKDVGGFVGGVLKEGRRSASAVAHRQVITLDADFATPDFADSLPFLLGCAWALYSTHKHTPDKPRLRLVIPASRPMTPDEYQAVARRIAADIGIEQFDDTTYAPERLMYWPSCSRDGEFVFRHADAPWLDVDAVLARYADWRDVSQWPVADRFKGELKRRADKAGDPRQKPGVIGAFCRAYDIAAAVAAFLPDTYQPTRDRNRYTYAAGSSSMGLVIYEGVFAYSHHATDPAGGRLVNAFDLVRIHRFGHLDEGAKEDTPINRLPSCKAMEEWAVTLAPVKRDLAAARGASAAEDFAPGAEDDWRDRLEYDRKGNLLPTRENYRLVLTRHPDLAGKLRLNEFLALPVAFGGLPWRKVADARNGDLWTDADRAALFHWFEQTFRQAPSDRLLKDAFVLATEANKFHPIRDWLSSLAWDGEPRLDTLFIRYLGAEDNAYTRAVTRKSLVAAVARVFEPGCKFDHMTVFIGRQGFGKSTFLHILGNGWTTDDFTTMRGKEAVEQLQGAWLVECAELTATKRAEIESVKHFITKRVDKARMAYKEYVGWYKRQCVFFGTTNDAAPLVDKTGNRRFWVLPAGRIKPTHDWRHDLEKELEQVWAEAVWAWQLGEPLYLEGEAETLARKSQDAHRHDDGLAGQIARWLDQPVPADWADWDIRRRREFFHSGLAYDGETVLRGKVCAREVWVECLGGELHQFTPAKAKDINEALRLIDGWEEVPSGLRFGPYGTQRGFRRAAEPAEAEIDGDDIPF